MHNSSLYRIILYVRYLVLRLVGTLAWLVGVRNGPLKGEAHAVCADKTEICELRGFVFSDYGVVIDRNWRLVSSISPVTWGNIKRHEALHKLWFPRPIVVDKRVLLLSSHQHQNYFHWLFDVIARMELVESNLDQYDKVIINNQTRFQRETIILLGLTKHFAISPKSNELLSVNQLTAPPIVGGVGGVTQSKVEYLRRLFPKQNSDPLIKKVYLSRSDAARRRVANEFALIEKLRRYGFVSITLSSFSVEEQINIFRHCEVVVAPHGAGLANITFMQEGRIVVELMPETYQNDCFKNIASYANLDFTRVSCETLDLSTDDMNVDLDSFLKKMSSMLQPTN